jgi:predicted AAA+ superfamily ATPase
LDLQIFFEEQEKLLEKISLNTKRYLFNKINWNLKSIGILGQRGCGKTTLMLQYIKQNYQNSDKALYISLDNFLFQDINLFEFAKKFSQYDGKILFIDEIHKYQNWDTYLKNIYDNLDLKVVFSGSSLLSIQKQNADLSRRSIIYHLENLSFREYLEFMGVLKFNSFTIEEILTNHTNISKEIVKNIKVLKYFDEYLKYGAYPFILEDKDSYYQKITQIINIILESDLPYINKIEFSQILKLKKLLFLLSQSVPFIPNITKLSQLTNISRPKIYEYLNYLEDAKIINSIKSKEKGYKILSKPEKLFMQNSNISYTLTKTPNIGNIRETFFVNMIKNYYNSFNKIYDNSIFLSKKGDFLVDEKYIFEIGGAKKSFKQIKNIENSFVVADDIEIGFKNKMPLWLFGFLY